MGRAMKMLKTGYKPGAMLFHQPLRRILFSMKRHSKDLEPRLPDSKTRLGFHYTERKETAILGSVSGQPTASRMGVSENI
jgi:hypothetical protein